jgi:hypothetical protein
LGEGRGKRESGNGRGEDLVTFLEGRGVDFCSMELGEALE